MPRRGQTRFVSSSVIVLLLSLLLWGCTKRQDQKLEAASNSENLTSPAQNGAGSDNRSSNAQAGPFANASAGTGTPGTNEQASPQIAMIPTGTPITVRLQQRLSSASAVAGERFEAVIDEPIVVGDQVVVPVGSLVTGHVVMARRSGRLRHPGKLGLTLDSVTVGQQNIPLATTNVVASGASHKKRNLAWIGGGTGGGALIGALAAGAKGALIGSGIGAAAGTTTAFITGKKKDFAFSSERRLRFRLDRDVNVEG